jgi:RNA polymerase sigma-70 factor (ECF subfamily)
MNTTTQTFESHRPRLFGIARRMLGSRIDAEDLLQDAYLRWHQSDAASVESEAAFLVTITTRLCLDRLRQRKKDSACGIDEAPAAALTASAPSPETERESFESLSAALATVFDRLGQAERAAFLLHDVFDYDYPDVARTLGKAEPACRQIVHRARKRVRDSRTRAEAAAEPRDLLMERLLDAVTTGDRLAVLSLIAADAIVAGARPQAELTSH